MNLTDQQQIPQRPRYQWVEEAIGEAIIKGELLPGEILPGESDLGEHYRFERQLAQCWQGWYV